MKKIRVLALILTLVMLFQGMPLTMGSAAGNDDTIVLYPEYPEKIERDYMYRIYVKQGNGDFQEIPVYNSMRHSNHYVNGNLGTYSEVDRRFCQFSATPSAANPVTVKVVINTNFSKVSIISPMYEITQEGKTREAIGKISPSKIQGNEIYFEIKNSSQYIFRINDDNISNLAIFADPVETDVPNKNASNVVVFNENNPAPNAIGTYATGAVSYASNTIFYIEGWQDVEFFELQSGQQLYIAPGAVLNSRIQIMGGNSNIKVFGRGMLRDYNDTRAYNKSEHQIVKRRFNYLFTVGSNWSGRTDNSVTARDITIKDIMLFDAKGFNIVFQGAKLCNVDNIKIVANEISTDGISFWGANAIKVKDSFLHVSDNVFVLDQFESLTVDNVLAGSTISTFYPQGAIYNTNTFSNINLFRAGTIFEPAGACSNEWGGTNNKIVVKNLSAVDCVAPYGSSSGNKTGAFFSTGNNAWEKDTTKYITLENVSLPEGTNSYKVEVGVQNAPAGNYNITLKNVYVGSTALTQSNVAFNDATSSGKASTVKVTNDGTYNPVTRTVTNASYSSAYKTYIRDASLGTSYYSLTKPYSKNNALYVSAKTAAEKLGFDTYFDLDDNSLTIYDENVLVRATAGSNIVLYNDTLVTLSAPVEYNGEEIMVPVEFFQQTVAPQTKTNGYSIIIGGYNRGADENLVNNGDFEDENALESWTTVNFARLTRYTEPDGNTVMRFFDKNIFLRKYINSKNETVDVKKSYSFQGVYQDVRNIVRANGPGIYRITFSAKCNETGLNLTEMETVNSVTRKKYGIFTGIGTGYIAGTPSQYGAQESNVQNLSTSWTTYTRDVFIGNMDNTAMYAAIVIRGGIDVSVDDFTFTKVSDVTSNNGTAVFTINTTATNNTLNYGDEEKTVTISGTDKGIPTIKYETTSDYIKLGTTVNTGSTTSNYGTKTATATIKVAYPSNYDRYAKVLARGGSGNVVAEITIKIPAHTTDVKHVIDYTSNLVVNETYQAGEKLDTSALKLTNVKYNDGTTGTVGGSDVTITGDDFTTAGEKTITVTYDNKSVSYTTTVVESSGVDLVPLGANIRIASEGRTAGLRFAANFKKNDLYKTYYGTGDYEYKETNNFRFGAIFIPVSMLGEGETVVDLFESGNTSVLEIVGKNVFEQDDQSLTFTGCITNIPKTKADYANTIQCVFYIKTRENADGEWTYIYSSPLQHSYYSVADKAYYDDYLHRPTLTEDEKDILLALKEIVDFVEEDAWINGWY